MSIERKLLEDENISVEYDIVNGLVCIDKIYLKEAKEGESKPITSYDYVSEVTGTTLRYSDFKKDEFTLKISGKDVFILGVQRLAVFVSEDFVDKVEILEDNTGLRVYLDDFLEEGETFSEEFFDAFSKEVLCTIVDIQDDGLVDFCADIAYVCKDETHDKFKQLITYIDKALI